VCEGQDRIPLLLEMTEGLTDREMTRLEECSSSRKDCERCTLLRSGR